jgi:hypothetical protein
VRLPDPSSWTPLGIGLRVVVVLIVGALAWTVVYRLFFQGQDLARERGNLVVAEEQGTAEGQIVDDTLQAVRERDVYREHVTTVVRETRKEIDDAWTGETVGTDVDAAGAAALCGLHDSLCRPAAPTAVQPVRGPLPGADAARPAAD